MLSDQPDDNLTACTGLAKSNDAKLRY